jgi:hypothetical protein
MATDPKPLPPLTLFTATIPLENCGCFYVYKIAGHMQAAHGVDLQVQKKLQIIKRN